MRASFILFAADRPLPAPVERSLRYVGPAAFAAIVVPALLRARGDGELGPLLALDAPLIALVAGALVMRATRNMVAMLAVGMVVLWVGRALGW